MDGSVQAYGRCIGKGGFRVSRGQPVTNPQPPLVLYDDRLYKVVEGMELGFNGFVRLTFAENRMSIDYRDSREQKADGRRVGGSRGSASGKINPVCSLRVETY